MTEKQRKNIFTVFIGLVVLILFSYLEHHYIRNPMNTLFQSAEWFAGLFLAKFIAVYLISSYEKLNSSLFYFITWFEAIFLLILIKLLDMFIHNCIYEYKVSYSQYLKEQYQNIINDEC